MAEFQTRKEKIRRLVALIISLVFMVGSGAGIYFVTEKIKEVEGLQPGALPGETIREQKSKLKEIEDVLKANEDAFYNFSEPIGWRVRYSDSTDRYPVTGLDGKAMRVYLDKWVDVLESKYKITKYYKWVGAKDEDKQGRVNITIQDLFAELEGIYANLIVRINTAVEARETAKKEEIDIVKRQVDQVKKDAEELYGSNLKDIGGRIKEVIDLEQTFRENQEQHIKDLEALASDLEKKKTEYAELRKTHLAQEKDIEKEFLEQQGRYDFLYARRRDAELKKESDGIIKVVDLGRQIAYIDIKHQDHLWVGTPFKVFSLIRGGEKVDRGEVEVIEVGKEYSKVVINKIYDATEPMKEGDYLYSIDYERNRQRNIAFAGKLMYRLGEEYVIKMMNEIGDTYQKKVDKTTNYLVLGKGYEKDPNYAFAKELGVRLILERDLYNRLGVEP